MTAVPCRSFGTPEPQACGDGAGTSLSKGVVVWASRTALIRDASAASPQPSMHQATDLRDCRPSGVRAAGRNWIGRAASESWLGTPSDGSRVLACSSSPTCGAYTKSRPDEHSSRSTLFPRMLWKTVCGAGNCHERRVLEAKNRGGLRSVVGPLWDLPRHWK